MYYQSLESVLGELVTLLLEAGLELYLRFRDRLDQLATLANQIGWGFGDFVTEQMLLLEDEFAQAAAQNQSTREG